MNRILDILTSRKTLLIGMLLILVLSIMESRWVFISNVHVHKLLKRFQPTLHYTNDYGVEYLDTRIVHEIYQMLKDTTELLDKNNIKYWADGGTLIGAIRHRGFIPWDDDADIAIKNDDIEKLKSLVEPLRALGYEIKLDNYPIKIFPYTGLCEGEKCETRFPSVDIFPMQESGGYYIHLDKAWVKDTFKKENIDNLERCKFGDFNIWCSSDPHENMKRAYGEEVFIKGSYYGLHYIYYQIAPVKWILRPWEFGYAPHGKLLDRVEKN